MSQRVPSRGAQSPGLEVPRGLTCGEAVDELRRLELQLRLETFRLPPVDVPGRRDVDASQLQDQVTRVNTKSRAKATGNLCNQTSLLTAMVQNEKGAKHKGDPVSARLR